MHAVGLHSALAIKRQRKRRDEQRRARERRYSSQSGDSVLTSPRLSTASFDRHSQKKKHLQRKSRIQKTVDSKVVTSIGLLHIGVVFLVLGGFLLISGILPGDIDSVETKFFSRWLNELAVIGLFSITIGCALIIFNRIIARREENDLEEYVKRQLTRSKSGHRLERDSETGELKTKQAKIAMRKSNDNCSTNQAALNLIRKDTKQASTEGCSTTENYSVLELTDQDYASCDEYSRIDNFNPPLPIREEESRNNVMRSLSSEITLHPVLYE